MQFYQTGAIVAAPTTSLPEHIGGERNWDYRYSWIRDATLTLYALYVLGYKEEAIKYFDFIEKTEKVEGKNKSIDLHLMHTIWGGHVPREKKIKRLSGYQNSKPVRVGNAASKQFQLDMYGALIDAHYFSFRQGIKITSSSKRTILQLAEKIVGSWKKKDSGIWEVRSKEEHFTYSKVMCWVGLNRVLQLAPQLKLGESQKKRYQKIEQEIKEWIWDNCYDAKKQIFRQHPNTNQQDASTLSFLLLHFLDKSDPRTKKVISNTYNALKYKDVFVYRYRAKDGIAGSEGAFLLCTFWLIAAWAALGETKKAKSAFDKFGKCINEFGLLPEEMKPNTGQYLGNYPQALSHIGYILSAYYLQRYSKKKK